MRIFYYDVFEMSSIEIKQGLSAQVPALGNKTQDPPMHFFSVRVSLLFTQRSVNLPSLDFLISQFSY